MIIMANVICSDKYCESTLNRDDNLAMTLGDKAVIMGGYALFLVVLSVLVLYGASQGIYVDLTSLS
jgi:hypothetical protein